MMYVPFLRRPCLLGLAFLWLTGYTASAEPENSAIAHQQDVIYGHKDGMALTMDVFLPANANGKGVIWVISSGGRSSRERIADRDFTEFLTRGYTVFAVVHGSAPRFNVQDIVADIRRAVRFVRYRAEKFRVDEGQLGIVGSSSGGYVALMVALAADDGAPDAADPVDRTSDKVAAMACFFAPTDLLNFGANETNLVDFQVERYGAVDPSFVFHEYREKSDIYKLIRDRETTLAMLKQYSPITHVTHDDPPTLIIHGDADPFVPFQQGESLYDALRESGVASRLVRRTGKGHAWDGWQADMKLIADWFDEKL